MVNAGLRYLQRALLPPTCVLCTGVGQSGLDQSGLNQAGLDLCVGCARELPTNLNACTQCGEQLTASAKVSLLCGACLRKPPRYQSTHCAFRYSYPIDHLVRALKYHDRLTYARVLGELLAHSLGQRTEPWPELLIPVPLANSRYRERGFNQASEVAQQLQTRLAIPLRADLLERTRATSEQAALDRVGRRKNVRNAFALRMPLTAKHVAIVDDVVTTGSTVNEIARVLRRAGAEIIEVWAVARASR